ncbi:MAG: AMP-binding protein [Alphaproteobacteria bacterium]|nr:AMP-binding protein [Alphaproteobacteria bacterium]
MLTFADPLRRATQVAAGKTAIISGDKSFTFAELADRCARLSGGLKKLGLEKGDRVAIWSNNNHQYVETYVGVPAGGLVVVPLNTRHSEPELLYALTDAQAKVLITDRDPAGLSDVVDRVVRIGDEYEALLQGAEPDSLGDGVTEDDLAGLFYTGGTTGQSKGVMLSHRNLVSNTFHWLSMIPQGEQDVFLVMAPLFHAAGSNSVLGSIWTTGCQVTLEAFVPANALDLIEKHQVTQTLGVPAMLSAIAEEQHTNPRQVESVRSISHGGSPIATGVLRRTSTAFPSADLNGLYGATELSPLATILRHEQNMLDEPTARSCGQSYPGVDVRILTTEGDEVASGEIGEIVVRGPNVMLGYWNKEEQTNSVLKDGAYWTGDLGYIDAQGFVYVVDRTKDMIVSGGENIYSTEVEEILYQHPAVLEAAVFGVPDETWGEAVHAAIVPRPEHHNIDPNEIIEFCRAHIAGYKVPKGIDMWTEPLPKSGPGKVLKRELRAPYWGGKDRAVN